MHKIILLALLVFGAFLQGQAQQFEWVNSSQSITGMDVAVNSEGDIITANHLQFSGYFGGTNIKKHSLDGQLIWSKSIPGPDSGGTDNYPNYVLVDSDDNIYILGVINGGTTDFDPGPGVFEMTASGIYILKLDTDGNFVFAKNYDNFFNSNFYFRNIALTASNHLYLSGRFYGTMDLNPDGGNTFTSPTGVYTAFIVKLDADGVYQYGKILDPEIDTDLSSSTVDAMGNFYYVGEFSGSVDFDPGPNTFELTANGGEPDSYISKLDPSGNFVWAKQIDTEFDVGGILQVELDNDLNIYLSTWHKGTIDVDLGPTDSIFTNTQLKSLLIKLNPNFELEWTYTFDQNVNLDLKIDNSNHAYMLGHSNIIKINPNGSISWNADFSEYAYYARKLDFSPSQDAFYVTGEFADLVDFDPGLDSFFLDDPYFAGFLQKLSTCNTAYSTISEEACYEYISPSGDYTWTSTGTYTDFIPNAAGCDSVITVNLTILNSSASISAILCNSYVSPSGDYTWTSPGIYSDIIPNTAGCDSLITIELISGNSSAVISETACYSYTSPSGNNTWTSSGNYLDIIPNAAGCDSLITIELTILNINIDNTLSQNNNILTANEINATYQWLDCDNNQAAISGETNQDFTATENGNYAVEITKDGCTEISDCINITGVGIKNNNTSLNLRLTPNPTDGAFTLAMDQKFQSIDITISNALGQIVSTQTHQNETQIELQLLGAAGIYYVSIVTKKGDTATFKVLKK